QPGQSPAFQANIEGRSRFRKSGRDFPISKRSYAKLRMASASSSRTSNTVYSFVICSRSFTRLVSPSSLSVPPWLATVVKPETSSPIPELSIYDTSLRFRRIFRCPLAVRSRRMSRRALDPSPRVIRPERSITLTSPTCRVFSLTLTSAALLEKTKTLFVGGHVLHQSHLRARRIKLSHLQVVHERAHQKKS